MTWSLIHRFHSDDADTAASEIVARDPESLLDDRGPLDEATRAQMTSVLDAVVALVHDAPIGEGGWEVRAGGHANPDGVPVDGQPHEMITLTISWLGDHVPLDPPPAPEPAVPAAPEPVAPITADGAEVAVAPAKPVVVDAGTPEGPHTADGSTVAPAPALPPLVAAPPMGPITADGTPVEAVAVEEESPTDPAAAGADEAVAADTSTTVEAPAQGSTEG